MKGETDMAGWGPLRPASCPALRRPPV